ARKGRVLYDTGAYSGFGLLAGTRATQMLGGWYATPNVHTDGYVVYTNKQVCGAVRGPGGPQAAFAVESHMDSLAARLKMDPLEFRRKNMPQAGGATPGVAKLRDVSLDETMRVAAERIGLGRVKLEKNQGIGFATGTWVDAAGPGGAATVTIAEDGTA